ncbi:MAG: hypothetical protein KC618_03955, partial [Candidatus Omnitrophica bacterium]|nr:hypothetical protein [Candidatus Omnitrophota bacterium]
LVTVLFLILVVSFERLFQNILGYKSILGSIIAALVIATVFTPLRNKIQKIFDRIFYQGTPEEISQQNELLRQEVAQAEKFKAVATLASGMAHEIKNPLTAIKTFSEYLRIKGEDPEFREKFSELVGKEVDRVDNLVHELLEFARPAPLTLKDTNIHKLLDETLEFLSSKLVKHNINTEKAFKSDIELIKADPNQLKQVFLNLFMNAIDAMEKGGTLTISTLNPNPSTLSISIKDTGCGIPKEDLKHIFDPFFTKKDNGTGLGLAISYGIIKEHHGDIKVKSKPNEGTEFIVELKLDS